MTQTPPPGSFEYKGTGMYLPKQAHVLIEAIAIRKRISAVAALLDAHMLKMHQAGWDITTISLLDGCAPFYAGLRECMTFSGHVPVQLSASSYTGTVSGELKIDEAKLLHFKVEGRVVYLIDDLVDTGKTMSKLEKTLYAMGALQVVTIVLLDKPSGRKAAYKNFVPHVAGYIVPDAWVFGFGMDDGIEVSEEWPMDNSWVRNLHDILHYSDPVLNHAVKVTDLEEIVLP